MATVAGGWFIFPKAIAALRRLMLDMNVLMSVAVIGAAIIGEWSEAAAVTFLFGLSEYLEAFSVQRARRAIESLMKLTPETALLKRGEAFEEVPIQQVNVDDVFAVKSGARVPLDGQVISGASAVNQAPITGESMPVDKKAGDDVFAGTINGEGSLEVPCNQALIGLHARAHHPPRGGSAGPESAFAALRRCLREVLHAGRDGAGAARRFDSTALVWRRNGSSGSTARSFCSSSRVHARS